MRPASMMVAAELLQVATQAGFAEDDHMVQALAADRTDDALDIRTLPWGAGRRQHLLDPYCLHLLNEVSPENAVTVAQQIPWCAVPWERLPQLVSGPLCGWV